MDSISHIVKETCKTLGKKFSIRGDNFYIKLENDVVFIKPFGLDRVDVGTDHGNAEIIGDIAVDNELTPEGKERLRKAINKLVNPPKAKTSSLRSE